MIDKATLYSGLNCDSGYLYIRNVVACTAKRFDLSTMELVLVSINIFVLMVIVTTLLLFVFCKFLNSLASPLRQRISELELELESSKENARYLSSDEYWEKKILEWQKDQNTDSN